MKKISALLALFSCCVLAFGQDLQKSCVRTPERYLDKTFTKAVYMQGVEIEIEGRSNPVVVESFNDKDYEESNCI